MTDCPVCAAKDETIAILRETLATIQAANKNTQEHLVNLADQYALARLAQANRPAPTHATPSRTPQMPTVLRRMPDKPSAEQLGAYDFERKTDLATEPVAYVPSVEASFESKSS